MISSPQNITYFVELAHTLNFSRASERLGISQPSLSVAIKRLELEIGAVLFHRHKNGVVLTKSGKQLLTHSKKLLHLWETMKTEALSSSVYVQGCVSIGCHPSVALETLHRFLPKVILSHPKLEIKLEHDLSRKTAENVINYSLDIGIVVNPIKHPDLIIQKLYDDKVALWHSKKIKIPRSLTSECAVIICDPELMQTQHILKKLQKKEMRYQRLITSRSLEVIARLTAYGVGLGILPANVAHNSGLGELVVLDKSPVVKDEICVVYRHENRNVKAVQTVIQTLKAAYR
jgi:DNA-binding transcriptional LysR family regulator